MGWSIRMTGIPVIPMVTIPETKATTAAMKVTIAAKVTTAVTAAKAMTAVTAAKVTTGEAVTAGPEEATATGARAMTKPEPYIGGIR